MPSRIAALDRFVERYGVVKAAPDRLSTVRWHVVIARQLCELACEVYTLHGLPTDPLKEIDASARRALANPTLGMNGVRLGDIHAT